MSARLVAAALTRAGFKVGELSDPSNARTGTAIAALGDEVAATPGSHSVIYVCGYVAAVLRTAVRIAGRSTSGTPDRCADARDRGTPAHVVGGHAGRGCRVGIEDVVPQSSNDAQISFGSMLRAGDNPHAGLAAALLRTSSAIGPSPLASTFSDMLHAGSLDLSKALADLPTALSAARGQMLVSRAPDVPSWLTGGPAPEPEPPATVAAGVAACHAPCSAVDREQARAVPPVRGRSDCAQSGRAPANTTWAATSGLFPRPCVRRVRERYCRGDPALSAGIEPSRDGKAHRRTGYSAIGKLSLPAFQLGHERTSRQNLEQAPPSRLWGTLEWVCG